MAGVLCADKGSDVAREPATQGTPPQVLAGTAILVKCLHALHPPLASLLWRFLPKRETMQGYAVNAHGQHAVETSPEREHPAICGMLVHLQELEHDVIPKFFHDPRSRRDRIDAFGDNVCHPSETEVEQAYSPVGKYMARVQVL